MGTRSFCGWFREIKAKADPYGMTNKKDNGKSKKDNGKSRGEAWGLLVDSAG
jgi:hypothetical protein